MKLQSYYVNIFLELLNLCDPVKFKSLLDWDGSAINVQHLKVELISKNMLQRLKKEYEEKNSTQTENIQQPSTSAETNAVESKTEESMETC